MRNDEQRAIICQPVTAREISHRSPAPEIDEMIAFALAARRRIEAQKELQIAAKIAALGSG